MDIAEMVKSATLLKMCVLVSSKSFHVHHSHILSLVFAINSGKDFKVILGPELLARLELYWDVYLITVLIGKSNF